MSDSETETVADEVLSPRCLAQLRALDPTGADTFVHRVLNTYLQSLERQQRAIAQAVIDQDAHAVGTAAHALKSASASVGAMALSAQCAALERLAHAGWAEPLMQALSPFHEAAACARAAVQRAMSSP